MAKKRKGELPSGSIRRQVYLGKEQKKDKNGVPMYDKNGKPIMKRIYASVTASSSEQANRDKAQALLDKDKLLKRNTSNLTIGEAIDRYIEDTAPFNSPTTIARYKQIRKYNFKCLMNCSVFDVNQKMIDAAVRMELTTPSERTGKPLKESTIKNSFGLVSSAIHKYNPAAEYSVRFPAKEKTFKTVSEPVQIYNAVKGTDIELPVLLAMWLSFSMSEIQGLKWGSIKGEYIEIEQVIVTVGNKFVEKSKAKEYERKRVHKLPNYILNLIGQMEKKDPEEKLIIYNSRQLYKKFVRAIEKAGLPHMTFHDLRHVNASVMHMLGVPDKYAMERGGWSTDAVMKNVYTHTFSKERQKVDSKIDSYFTENVIGGEDEKYRKYKNWLALFDKADSKESRKQFDVFMQHEMQHIK